MGIPIVVGRGLNPRDDENSQKVAILNESAARYYFGDDNPIGKRIGIGEASVGAIEIVGVARNSQYADLRGGITPMAVFVPYRQYNVNGLGQMAFEVRTLGDPLSVTAAVRQTINSIDKGLPLFEVKTQQEQIDQSMAQEILFAKLSSLFGLLALILACVGLYGVISYGVARRTKEMGIRMALGAQRNNVVWLVLKESLLLIIIGIAIGLPAAFAATRLIASTLFGLGATDPATFAVVAMVLTVVAMLACYLPARRATKIDPMIALRYE
jgi:predicted permease